jgi:hypothetical protein
LVEDAVGEGFIRLENRLSNRQNRNLRWRMTASRLPLGEGVLRLIKPAELPTMAEAAIAARWQIDRTVRNVDKAEQGEPERFCLSIEGI